MAGAVARAIEQPGHLVVEAGTGVGKSFAYLVPAIQAAVALKKKVVVSTHTIALQEQLIGKDIPFLRSVMGQEFSAVLVKGRSNYISLRRLDVAIQNQLGLFADPQETDQLVAIAAVVQTHQRRQPSRPGLSAASQCLGGRSKRGRQLPGQGMPAPQGLLLLQCAAAGPECQRA